MRQPIARGAQVLADHAADLVRIGQQVIQRAVFGKPFHRCLGPALGHARHVVHGIAHQRQIIHDAFRRHAELGQHARFVQHLVAHGVDQRDMRVDQLREVLVAGGDDAARAVARCLLRQGADDVVGLNPVDHQDIPAGRRYDFVQWFDLQAQVVRHRRAMRLVFGIPVVAERFALRIEHAGAIICRVIGTQAAQHVEHAVDRSGRFALRAAQVRHGMEGAI